MGPFDTQLCEFIENTKGREVTKATQLGRAFGAILLVRNELLPQHNKIHEFCFGTEMELSVKGLDEMIEKCRYDYRMAVVERGEMDLEASISIRSVLIENLQETEKLLSICEQMAIALRPCLLTSNRLAPIGSLLVESFVVAAVSFPQGLRYLLQLETLQVS